MPDRGGAARSAAMSDEKSTGGPAGGELANVAEVRAIPGIVLNSILWSVQVAWVAFPRSPRAYADVQAWLEHILAVSLDEQEKRRDRAGGAAPGREPVPGRADAEGGGAAPPDGGEPQVRHRTYRARVSALTVMEDLGPAEVERLVSEAVRRAWVVLPPERRNAEHVASMMRRLLRGCLEMVKEERELLGCSGAPGGL